MNVRLGEIVARVREVAELVERIAVASAEQRGGLGQVSASVADLDLLTRRNAEQARHNSASATELAVRTDALRAVADALAALVIGDRAQTRRKASV